MSIESLYEGAAWNYEKKWTDTKMGRWGHDENLGELFVSEIH